MVRESSWRLPLTLQETAPAAGRAFVLARVEVFLRLHHLLLHFLRLTHELLHIAARNAGETASCHNEKSSLSIKSCVFHYTPFGRK